jgi:hypothetical protein
MISDETFPEGIPQNQRKLVDFDPRAEQKLNRCLLLENQVSHLIREDILQNLAAMKIQIYISSRNQENSETQIAELEAWQQTLSDVIVKLRNVADTMTRNEQEPMSVLEIIRHSIQHIDPNRKCSIHTENFYPVEPPRWSNLEEFEFSMELKQIFAFLAIHAQKLDVDLVPWVNRYAVQITGDRTISEIGEEIDGLADYQEFILGGPGMKGKLMILKDRNLLTYKALLPISGYSLVR